MSWKSSATFRLATKKLIDELGNVSCEFQKESSAEQVDTENVNDIGLLEQTIDDAWKRSPRCENCFKEHIALDKGSDSQAVRTLLENVYRYIAQIKSRGDQSKDAKRSRRKTARRWVVERTHGWLNRFRGIFICWEKKLQNHIACLHLACAYLTYARS